MRILFLCLVLIASAIAQEATPDVVGFVTGKQNAIWAGAEVEIDTSVTLYAKAAAEDRTIRVTVYAENESDRTVDIKLAACQACGSNQYVYLGGVALGRGSIVTGIRAVRVTESPVLPSRLAK